MPSPLISIVLCTYNRKALLPSALNSVHRQTYRNWELIAIDDGSTDGSAVVLRNHAREDKRVRVRRQSNKGLSKARNAGLRLARGKYITFLDSDDEYSPRHLSKRVAFLQSHPGLDGIYGGMKIVGPRQKRFVPDVDRPGKMIHASRCHAAGTLLATTRSLKAIGGFRSIAFSEDYDLIKRLAERFAIGKVGFRTYIYHVDAGSRLCDLFAKGGTEEIRRYRRRGKRATRSSRLR